jgi:hypothetical protein
MKNMRHFVYLIPIMCLVVIASVQLFLAREGLSAWKGGGFGMYAVNELRYLRVYAMQDNKWQQLDVGNYFDASTVVALPNHQNIVAFAKIVCTRQVTPSLQIEVWKGNFQEKPSVVTFERNTSLEVDCE